MGRFTIISTHDTLAKPRSDLGSGDESPDHGPFHGPWRDTASVRWGCALVLS